MFWERSGEVADAERHVKNIERGEHRIKRHTDIMQAIAAKLDRYNNPWQVRHPPPPLPGGRFWTSCPHQGCLWPRGRGGGRQ